MCAHPTKRPIRYYWEDLTVGSVHTSAPMLVTREAVLAFARDFDPQPFHLDDEAAQATPFGRLAASGWHTCAMTMRMTVDTWLLESSSLGSPGVENLRWLKPVYPGDTLKVCFTVLEARPMNSRPTVGLIRSQWQVFNQDDAVVLQMEGWGMFGRRPVTPRPVMSGDI